MNVNFPKSLCKLFQTINRRKFCEISNFIKSKSSSEKEILFDLSHSSKIGLIGLNRPKSKNSLGKNLIEDFKCAIESLHEKSDIRCVIIASLVPNIFCAGADLKERKSIPESEIGNFVSNVRNLFQLLAEVPVPTICAIDGPALGGGLELALACDLRFASDEAEMGLVETRLAIIPGAGGTQRLSRLIGVARAKELIFTARTIKGAEAATIGLVNASLPQNSSGDVALSLSIKAARAISANGPIAIRSAKTAIDRGIIAPTMVDALSVERDCYLRVIPTTDRMEGLNAFQQKRKPQYEGK